MRQMLIGTALALVAAAPAYAEPSIYADKDAGAYIGIEGGMWFPDKLKNEFDSNNGYGFDYDVERDVGYDVDVIGGYDFGMIRVEGELGYKRVKHGQGELTVVNNGTVLLRDEDKDGGRTSVWSAMGNVLLDFGGPENVNLFVGGGIGYAKVKVRSEFIDYKETGFAWQLLAGARYPINRNIDVGVKYRYADLGDYRESEPFGEGGTATFRVKSLRSHSALFSLIYNFGNAAPPPPPPPPPPEPAPPPPPPTQTCADGSVILASDACPPPPPPPPPPPEPERG